MADEAKTETKPEAKHAKEGKPNLWYMIRNSLGRKDGMFTLSYGMGLVVIYSLFVGATAGGSVFAIKLGSAASPWFSGTWNVPKAEWLAAVAMLPPLAAYVLRKRDDAKKAQEG
jgi:hypothetical protein